MTAIPIPPNPTGKRFTKGQAVRPSVEAPQWLIDKIGGRAATIQTDYGYDLSYDVRVEGLGWYVKAFAAWLEPVDQP